MDPRRNSGSYARSNSQYHDYEQYPPQQQPSSAHAGRAAGRYDGQPGIQMTKTRKPEVRHSQNRPEPHLRDDPRGVLPDQIYASNYPPNYPLRQRSKHGSVSDRSPLQKLEGKLDDISKEEKRVRIETAEHRARQAAAANQSRRVHAGGQQFLSDEPGLAGRTHERRYSSAPAPAPERNGDRQLRRSSMDYGGRPVETVNPHAADASQKFRRASDALRMQNQPLNVENTNSPPTLHQGPTDQRQPGKSSSKEYRHRARDAGFAGAAAAAAVPSAAGVYRSEQPDSHNDRRRSSTHQHAQAEPMALGNSQNSNQRTVSEGYSTGNKVRHRIPVSQQQMHSDRAGAGQGLKAAIQHQDPDPIPPNTVRTGHNQGPSYNIPPQTAGGQDARNFVGFANVQPVPPPQDDRPDEHHHHGISSLFHRHHQKDGVYRKRPELQEWRQAGIARLTADDLDVQVGTDKNAPWWEGRGSRRGSSGSSAPGAYDGPYDEPAKTFRPPLFLKCGPLLRYTGLRRERLQHPTRTGTTEREVWRGTVMIVTQDEHSSYEDIPTLRLFAQPMDLLSPLSSENEQDLPAEYLDPVAGQVKVSRTGRPLYVRPVDVLEDGLDISRVENESGLFELTKSSSVGPQQVDGPEGQRRHDRTRIRARDGEKTGKYREVRAARLHTERGVTFWRFSLEIELGSSQARVAYRINRGPAIGFWVPGRGQSMNIMFHSCNGFSLSVNPDEFTGPDPLWRDVLNKHQSKPFHVMLGGGDQIYNDAAVRDTIHFKEWLQTKNPEHKHRAEFTEEMQNELETFYLDRYSMWFSQGLFGMANSQIPMVNIWDDHDIIDGYGSYPHHFMSTRIFTGLGAVAFKYYMLFQHQSVVSETQREEPSWVLGASPGPYINELSRSVFMFLGRNIAFLGLDCRTERMRDEVLSQQSYDIVFDRCRSEIIKGETKHLIVLLGVPIAYPRLNFLENILTSRVMDPIKAIGRTGLLGGFVNKFDGGVEILDDLDDHWTAKHHKPERNWFIQELQELAADKSVRVTILGGDVHLGAVGQFYTNRKLGVPKDRDHRYMPNVISSAIVNTPPPNIMGDVLNKRNKIHHLDAETDEDMIPMFEQDVNGKARNNLHLLPRRNFCSIREYIPGSTPPPSPGQERQPTIPQDDLSDERQYPPGSMARSASHGRGGFRPGNLVRRLSGSSTRERQPSVARGQVHAMDAYGPNQASGDVLQHNRDEASYFPPTSSRPTNTFHRRPTDYSEKAALKASARGGSQANTEGHEYGHINLEGGLDIALNMEVDQRDPAGMTRPYRLLVPALWYEGAPDINTARFKSRGASIMDRLKGRSAHRPPSFDEHSLRSDESRSSSESPEGLPGSRLDDRALTSRLQTGEREPTRHTGQGNYPHGHSGPSDTRGFNKEIGPPPSRNRHPALANAESDKAYEVPRQPPIGPHPSEAAEDVGREKRSWNIFGRRRQPPSERHNEQEPYDDYTETEGSFTGSEFDGESDQQQPRERRPSMAERIFGKSSARRDEDRRQDELPIEQDTAKKPGWKVWR